MYFELNSSIELNLNSSDHIYLDRIPVLDANDLTYSNFFENFILSNSPCVIKNVTQLWQSTQHWISENKPNFKYLRDCYGQYNVTVYNCLERYYNTQRIYETTFENYLDYFESYDLQDERKIDYVKNWHLKLNNESDLFYEVPIFFASDWLNEYYIDCSNDDYRFVYMGPKDSWTPFHVDVYTSYSWSVNVLGRKKWLLLPPGEEVGLKDNLGNLPYDLIEEGIPQQSFEVIQEAGEAIFVPSGWHHQVWNLEHAISINHNWINGCNIENMYMAMTSHLKEVRKEIQDCIDMPDFEEHCQLMLNASFGMDFIKFYDFLKFISLRRINMLEDQNSRVLFHGHQIGTSHILFDLRALSNVLRKFLDNSDVSNILKFNTVDLLPKDLLEQIVNILDKN